MSLAPVIVPPAGGKSRRESGLWVSEEVYWRDYYALSDTVYEWNNGRLEEKPVSDYQTYLIYDWIKDVFKLYLQTRPLAAMVGLDMGFRLAIPGKVTIRKPDLGIVLDSNPIALELDDATYHGIFDMCIEALSDSDKEQKERDTIVKKAEYAAAGVQEYFILHHSDELAFYRLNARGVYTPIRPLKGGIIRSKVLPGFQFRIGDLATRPQMEALMEDPVYRDFVFPAWQADKRLRREAEQRAEAEAQRAGKEARRAEQAARRAEQEAKRVAQEKQLRLAAEQRAEAAVAEIARLQALLADRTVRVK